MPSLPPTFGTRESGVTACTAGERHHTSLMDPILSERFRRRSPNPVAVEQPQGFVQPPLYSTADRSISREVIAKQESGSARKSARCVRRGEHAATTMKNWYIISHKLRYRSCDQVTIIAPCSARCALASRPMAGSLFRCRSNHPEAPPADPSLPWGR